MAVLDQRVARAAQRINVGQAGRRAGVGSFTLAHSPVSSISGPIQVRPHFKRDDQVKSNSTKKYNLCCKKFKLTDFNHRHVSARAVSGPRGCKTRASLAAGGCDDGRSLRLQWSPFEARKRPFRRILQKPVAQYVKIIHLL